MGVQSAKVTFKGTGNGAIR